MTPSQKIKKLFKAACKATSSTKDIGLKSFARTLLKTNPEAKEWFLNKSGLPQKKAKEQRLKLKGANIREIALATKNAKKKKKAPAATKPV